MISQNIPLYNFDALMGDFNARVRCA